MQLIKDEILCLHGGTIFVGRLKCPDELEGSQGENIGIHAWIVRPRISKGNKLCLTLKKPLCRKIYPPCESPNLIESIWVISWLVGLVRDTLLRRSSQSSNCSSLKVGCNMRRLPDFSQAQDHPHDLHPLFDCRVVMNLVDCVVHAVIPAEAWDVVATAVSCTAKVMRYPEVA